LEEWFGAQQFEDRSIDSFQELKRFIKDNLMLRDESDIPFLIREHERKFQYGVSHSSIWQKP
jgi:hypothetical protein